MAETLPESGSALVAGNAAAPPANVPPPLVIEGGAAEAQPSDKAPGRQPFPELSVDVTGEEKEVLPSPLHSPTPKYNFTGTNVFVAGIPTGWDQNKVKEIFSPFGEITSMKLVSPRHFAFVMYKTAEQAENAIRNLHHYKVSPSGCILHLSLAMHDEGAVELPGPRLFVRGLPTWMSRDEFRNIFAPFGNIVECSLLMDSNRMCKGVGFIQYSATEEATAAIDALHGKNAVDKWEFPVEIKYSETAEVRSLRQHRNRERLSRTTPTATPSSVGSTPQSTRTGAPIAGQILPLTPQGRNVMLPANAQVNLVSPPISPSNNVGLPFQLGALPVYQAPPPLPSRFTPMNRNVVSASGPQPQIVLGATPTMSQTPHLASPMNINVQAVRPVLSPHNMRPFPGPGDLFFGGAPINEQICAQLTARFGTVERMQQLSGGQGFVLRMMDANIHIAVAQALNGAIFSTGHVLQVAIVSS